jgi:hypothetical protein
VFDAGVVLMSYLFNHWRNEIQHDSHPVAVRKFRTAIHFVSVQRRRTHSHKMRKRPCTVLATASYLNGSQKKVVVVGGGWAGASKQVLIFLDPHGVV